MSLGSHKAEPGLVLISFHNLITGYWNSIISRNYIQNGILSEIKSNSPLDFQSQTRLGDYTYLS